MPLYLLRSRLKINRIQASLLQSDQLSSVTILSETHKLQLLLEPLSIKQACLKLLLSYVGHCICNTQGEISSIQLLYLIISQKKKHTCKRDIYTERWKFLRSINKYNENECTGAWPMEQSLMGLAAVHPKIIQYLYIKRKNVGDACHRFDIITRDIEKCYKIKTCTSIQHYNEHGCPICHVFYIGSSVENQYIESIDLETNLPTLQPLEYQLDLLLKERVIQQQVVHQAKLQLAAYEDPLRQQVATNLQNWICCRLSRKRNERWFQRHQQSCFTYHIKQLVKMKNYIDELFKQIQNFKLLMRMNDCFLTFSIEYQEYVEYLIKHRKIKVQKIVRKFVYKLQISVDKTRARLFLEQNLLKLQYDADEKTRKYRLHQKELKMIKFRLEKLETQQCRCYYSTCNGRIFTSKQRYDTHQLLHVPEKLQKKLENQKFYKSQLKNNLKENEFLLKLSEYRQHSEAINSSTINKNDSNTLPDIIFPELQCSTILPPLLNTSTNNIENNIAASIAADTTDSQLTYFPHIVNNVEKVDFYELNQIHQHTNSIKNHKEIFFLQLMSNIEGIQAPLYIELNSGYHSIGISLDATHIINIINNKNSKDILQIAQIHCILEPFINHKNELQVMLYDNDTTYGTYLISKDGIKKAYSKTISGILVHPGDVICIASNIGTSMTITTTDSRIPYKDVVMDSCLMYRVGRKKK